MLIDFSVSNYLSFKDEQTLSLTATNLNELNDNIVHNPNGQKINLLRSAIVYGPNASGKSNLLKAISQLRNFILYSHKLEINQEIPSYEPFKLDTKSIKSPTKFEIEFIAKDNNTYKYIVAFENDNIKLEELYFYPKNQEALLFSREEGRDIRFGNYLKGKKKSIEEELLPNQLFLTKAAYSKNEQLFKIYVYFLEGFTIIDKSEKTEVFSTQQTSKSLSNKDDISTKIKIEKFISAFDTGITSIDVENLADEVKDLTAGYFPDKMPDHIKKMLMEKLSLKPKTHHNLYDGDKIVGKATFNLDEESFGTIKLYGLASYIINALEKGTILIIDEIDNSLHPHISSLILSLFNNPSTNKHNAQLITATHDTSLLNPQIIRRDQIWFTQKKANGSTQLYSLIEFNKSEVRANTPFSNWYLNGRFDAIPLIDKQILEIFEEDSCDITESNKNGKA